MYQEFALQAGFLDVSQAVQKSEKYKSPFHQKQVLSTFQPLAQLRFHSLHSTAVTRCRHGSAARAPPRPPVLFQGRSRQRSENVAVPDPPHPRFGPVTPPVRARDTPGSDPRHPRFGLVTCPVRARDIPGSCPALGAPGRGRRGGSAPSWQRRRGHCLHGPPPSRTGFPLGKPVDGSANRAGSAAAAHRGPPARRGRCGRPVPPCRRCPSGGSRSGRGGGGGAGMDRELLRQALNHHGPALLSLLRAEQHDNPDFRGLLPPPGAAPEPPRGAPPAACSPRSPSPRKERASIDTEIKRFIAKKADLLFAHSWKPNGPIEDTIEENEGCYAVMPPLERFLEVPREERRELFFRDIERGDIVIGRITSIREFGFFMVLICLGSGVIREIADLEITALCPVRDVPPQSNHGDPLSYYQTGDLIRAALKDVDRYHEKLAVSLYSSALPPNLSSTKLGVITSDDFPLHYKRSLEVASTGETFEEVLHRSPGFANPSLVEYLAEKLGLSESNPPSLLRSLQIKNFNEEDFAPALRKKQSASWALKCVKAGVDYFKVGRHVEAMNEYNKALEIDPQNVEALVARGALYATKGSLNKAIGDFETALENCPTHRNARKYLCQTLVERGGQLEEEEKLLNAESYYKKALNLDETFQEAEEALTKLRKHMQKSLEMREKQAAKEERQKAKKIETSAEKLRKLLKEEKR
ncbi:PREDICTED: tetratricopeptide repeat protein 14 [Pseudopodoces humilis]|uniref:tetratricopeptide repeat protein 14 n=1 Tax=Pseudopodoces humilis TaxID=181119 RepID=UPI0006B81DBD|nr:PREDICTED: tetratricopeptide repeat protein 14 [Pseudopodoces humilis]